MKASALAPTPPAPLPEGAVVLDAADLLAATATRYGVGILPGARVVAVPQGVGTPPPLSDDWAGRGEAYKASQKRKIAHQIRCCLASGVELTPLQRTMARVLGIREWGAAGRSAPVAVADPWVPPRDAPGADLPKKVRAAKPATPRRTRAESLAEAGRQNAARMAAEREARLDALAKELGAGRTLDDLARAAGHREASLRAFIARWQPDLLAGLPPSRPRGARPCSPDVAARRARLLALAAEHTRDELAVLLNISKVLVSHDFMMLRRAGHKVTFRTRHRAGGVSRVNQAQIAARRAEVARLRATNTLDQMALALEVSPSTINKDLRALGLTDKTARGKLSGQRLRDRVSASVVARRAEVARLRPDHSNARMAELLGVSAATISSDLAALGLPYPSRRRRHAAGGGAT